MTAPRRLRIYVASSWRNPTQPEVIMALRKAGHDVYDFRHPRPGISFINANEGFHWSEISKEWQTWTPEQFRKALNHPIANEGFLCDKQAMLWAEACALILPCGRSAHLEAGYFMGAGKFTAILLSDGEPELMYALADRICLSLSELIDTFEEAPRPMPPERWGKA